jgi:hypothetical protein
MAINFLDGIAVSGLLTQSSEATALVIDTSNVVGTRELGSNAFNSTTIPTNNNQLTNGEGYTTNTGTTTASNSQTFTNKAGNISQWTNNSGYLTSLSGAVLTTGNQTVAGTKTFSSDLIASSDIGIGTASPISQLHIRRTSSPGPIIQLENAAGGSGADTLIRFGDSSENYSYSVGSDDSANSFRISYNGTSYNGAVPGTNDFLIFSTSGNAEIPNGDLKVTLGSIAVGNISNSATDGRIDASNDVVAFSTSDIRLKDNIKTIDKALDKVNSIQGIEFDWIEKEEVHGNKGHDIGVIAQEIEKVLPDVVTTRDSGYKAVKYEKIVPLLIEAIKDLSKQVDGLKRLI